MVYILLSKYSIIALIKQILGVDIFYLQVKMGMVSLSIKEKKEYIGGTMKGVSKYCGLNVLVLASVNKEITMVLSPGQEETIIPGMKTKVFSLRQSSGNSNRAGWPEDPYKYYIVWKKGEQECPVFAKEIRFDSFAGSSFNVVDHLSSLGIKNLGLAAFVDNGVLTAELSNYCRNKGIRFIPLWASNTGITFVMETEDNPDAALCMEKPAAIDTNINRGRLLLLDWDMIVVTSIPDSQEFLDLVLELFLKNSKSIRAIIPSLRLVMNSDPQIQRTFREILKLTTVFQVNHREAKEFVNSELSLFKEFDPVKELVNLVANPVTIVTKGKYGSALIVEKDGGTDIVEQDALKPIYGVKSTVGSGDAFLAGFLRIYCQAKHRLDNKILRLAGRIGSEIAMRNLASYGGNLSLDPEKKLSPDKLMEIVKCFKRQE